MSNPAPQLVQKLWNYCNILRDDGLSYGDYVEQLTFLLFLKMADEQSRPPFNPPSPGYGGTGKPSPIPKAAWAFPDVSRFYRETVASRADQFYSVPLSAGVYAESGSVATRRVVVSSFFQMESITGRFV
jgi:hypothetical protein